MGMTQRKKDRKSKPTLTPDQAQILVDAHDIMEMIDNDEEVYLLHAQNPELLEAYKALVEIANS